jgi:demethylmenaquinone methyltransferase/2-methoxy-6-polyprenyl-1,4-benzoquinol methylase
MQKEYVRSLFDNIAYRYDLLNHLLSGGIDLYWRRTAIHMLAGRSPKRILDVATGTGDFALASMKLGPDEVVGVDISEPMLAIGRKKIARKNLNRRIRLETGEAEHLAFADNEFDAAIVAFGARNFEDLDKGLAEMFRVLRNNGTIIVLEFSRPGSFPFKQLYLFYFKFVLPRIGRMVSGNDEAYQYLPDTVLKFPEGKDFLDRLRRAGFTTVKERRLTFGIATIYLGEK